MALKLKCKNESTGNIAKLNANGVDSATNLYEKSDASYGNTKAKAKEDAAPLRLWLIL
jgi:hypothetical protein